MSDSPQSLRAGGSCNHPLGQDSRAAVPELPFSTPVYPLELPGEIETLLEILIESLVWASGVLKAVQVIVMNSQVRVTRGHTH